MGKVKYGKFNKLKVPETWEHYWSKYPEGYTILEALLNWVESVDKLTVNVNNWNEYLDDFVEKFDKELRDNVVNILKEWQESGYLDVVINEALTTRINDLEDTVREVTFDYISLDKSLSGEGKDSHSALVNLASRAKTEDKGLYVPNGQFYISEDLMIEDIRNIIIDGDIIMAPGKTLYIHFDSQRTLSCKWEIGRVLGGKLQIAGLKNGNTRVQYATHLELWADGDIERINSMAYSQFHLGDTRKLTIDSQGGPIGWINENNFYGGRLKDFTMSGNYNHNNNKFYGSMIEGAKMHFVRGVGNNFYDIRLEGNNDIVFEKDSADNLLVVSWQQYRGVYLRNAGDTEYDFVDRGTGNQVVNKLDENYDIRTLFELHPKSGNFDLGAIEKRENHLRPLVDYRIVYQTDLIEITTDIGINGISEEKLFRAHITFYDENRNLITRDQSDYRDMTWQSMEFDTSDSTLKHMSNVRLMQFAIFRNSPIKYFKVVIVTGYKTVDKPFDYFRLNMKHIKRAQVPVPVSSKYKQYNFHRKPDLGSWEPGDVVVNNSANIGRFAGWICGKGGTFGTSDEPEFYGYGLITSEVE